MKLYNEDDLLKEDVRLAIIKEITGDESLQRKADALRRHEILRDKNKKWVIEALSKEGYKETTLAQMKNRAANISIFRRIASKLAKTYSGGVERKAEANDQKTLDESVKLLKFNKLQKKVDLFREAFKNTTVFFCPTKSDIETRADDQAPLYEIKAKVLAPWQYDVIECSYDSTRAMCYVLTDFPERDQFVMASGQAAGAQGIRDGSVPAGSGDGRDQMIADNPADKGRERQEFIFWSAKYHFTCDKNGKIIPEKSGEAGTENPIKMLPFADVHDEQDDNYWAEGGEDMVEGSILINKLLTDGNYIAFVQGWGQLVISAPQIPKKLTGGPDNAFMFETKEGQPEPKVYFATSNPNIAMWLESVRMHLAMLLSTNGLSPRTVSAKLDATNVASGIAMLIENSDVDEENKDTQTTFQEVEPNEWAIVAAWHTILLERKSLVKAWAELTPMKEPRKVALKFLQAKPPVTEKETLDAMKLRKELGISTLKDLVKRDNPDLDEKGVNAKVAELMKEKKENAAVFGVAGSGEGEGPGNLVPGKDGKGAEPEDGKPGSGKPPTEEDDDGN